MKKFAQLGLFDHVPLLSMLLLLLANLTFGIFIHEYTRSVFVWGAAVAYIVLQCSILTIAWRPTYKFVLQGFKSGTGYTLLALGAASFAVVLAVWVRISGHFLVMLAAALLLRVKTYTGKGNNIFCFISMLSVSLLGLGISWLIDLDSLVFFR